MYLVLLNIGCFLRLGVNLCSMFDECCAFCLICDVCSLRCFVMVLFLFHGVGALLIFVEYARGDHIDETY